jgi:hypothetical protein
MDDAVTDDEDSNSYKVVRWPELHDKAYKTVKAVMLFADYKKAKNRDRKFDELDPKNMAAPRIRAFRKMIILLV